MCGACGAASPAGAGFCIGCGAPLRRSCSRCGAEAPSGARFCPSCGADLAGEATLEDAPSEQARGHDLEQRRTVTVLFADLSGYTAISERLDHETVKLVVERCLTRLAAEVERYGGRVDKYIGDNVMAVFGAPLAHEDDPARAVRSALAMQAVMKELAAELGAELDLELALRVGVNTGEVLAGQLGGSYTVVGDAVNVAARLQAAAPVGGVLVGERTRRLSDGQIVYRALEPLTLKGKTEPVQAWEAVELTEPAPAAPPPAGPLIGRGEELARLEATLERVIRDSTPHLLTVIAQAGVGKSRLLAELERRVADGPQPPLVLHGRCSAFGEGGVYRPLTEMLREACGIAAGASGESARAALRESLLPLLSEHEGPEQARRRLAPLERLFGSAAEIEPSFEEPEQQQAAREGFFGAARAAVEALARERPLLLTWDDIHWADEGTLDLIDYLARWMRGPVMQLALARDDLVERRPDWSVVRRTISTTFLEPLPPADAQRLVESLLAAAGTSASESAELAERSGGNPLFAEAMVQRLAEDADAGMAQLPDTVQGLLAARLDSLEPAERSLVADAAVLGRTFAQDALPRAGRSAEQLEHTLAALIERGILVPGEGLAAGAQRRWAFKHVLIRDVAYEMLPKAARARRHAEVARLILEQGGGAGEDTAAVVAEHFSRAASFAAQAHLPPAEQDQLRAQALAHGEAAGDAAAALYSNEDALRHYQAAVELSGADAGAAARLQEKVGELALRLGRIDTAIDAWERCLGHEQLYGDSQHVAELHRKIGAAFAHGGDRRRAIEQHQLGINLIKDGEPSLTLARLYEDAAWLYVQVGDNMLAIYAAEKALRLAETLGEARAASRAHGIFGRVFGRIGDTEKARENLERAVTLARRSDPAETILALQALGHNLEHGEGDHAAAGASYAEALALAERIGDVPAQIELQAALGQLALRAGDWAEVQRAADVSAKLAEAEGLVGKLCLADILHASLRHHEGGLQEARALFEKAHELAARVGWSEVSLAALMGLAGVLGESADLAGARSALLEARALCDRAGLLPQSVRANAQLASVCLQAGDIEAAREAAGRALEDSARVHDPASAAAAQAAEAVLSQATGPAG